ncbi:MAG: hypothetical protein AAFQ98_05670 [Bacteroidota bacterium]
MAIPEAMSDFKDYLLSKKIDPDAFLQGDAKQYQSLEEIFVQVSPASFTQQKLFLINPIRRAYPLPPEKMAEKDPLPKKSAKPTVPKPTMPKAAKPTIPKPSSNPNKPE